MEQQCLKPLLWPLSCVACLLCGLVFGVMIAPRPHTSSAPAEITPLNTSENGFEGRTGISPQIAKWILEDGTLGAFTSLSLEAQAEICNDAATRFHPGETKDFIRAKAKVYRNTITALMEHKGGADVKVSFAVECNETLEQKGSDTLKNVLNGDGEPLPLPRKP